jgi:PadR family transcriptional regulator, regulatory protein PadR
MCESGGCKDEHSDKGGDCHCESKQDKFIDACLLLLIAQGPSHGYELVEKLKRYGYEAVDPTKVYRRLRRLEGERFLESAWSADTTGPARRAYRITEEGQDFLQTWLPSVQRSIESYRSFLDDLNALRAQA